MSLIPAGGGPARALAFPGRPLLVAILIVAFYPLNEARMSKIETELKTRRASETPTPSAA